MERAKGQRGAGILLALVLIVGAGAAAFAASIARSAAEAAREQASDRAIALARDALIAHAADRPIDAVVGPGYLPCPDLDDDGWAESTCGSLDGSVGQARRLGRLPWKTLGLPDLRDGHGERLWYAVSTKHKGLLNCAASHGCVDMSPGAALGTITVRDMAGRAIHDGTLAGPEHALDGGAAAVVIAAGPPLDRDGAAQRRGCEGGCDSAGRCVLDPPWLSPRCHPAGFLDRAPAEAGGEDNASFVDRHDAAGRPLNGDGFIQGPVARADGGIAVNDRIAVVAYRDLMPRVMKRVALEAMLCLRGIQALAVPPSSLPAPAPACGGGQAPSFGRIPEAVHGAPACGLRVSSTPAWWNTWRDHVTYAPAAAFTPVATPAGCAAPGSCITLLDPESRTLGAPAHFAIVVERSPAGCATGALRCGAHACTHALLAPHERLPRHVVAVSP